jgi:uncharacterized protein YaaR (DUF327 family)
MQSESLVNNTADYIKNKEALTRDQARQAYTDYIKNLSHEEVVAKITQLTTDNYMAQQELSKLEGEIKECEKVLKIECTPENIVEYKNKLDRSMRTALKNLAIAEEALMEEAKDLPDDARRKWLEDIIQQKLMESKNETTKVD